MIKKILKSETRKILVCMFKKKNQICTGKGSKVKFTISRLGEGWLSAGGRLFALKTSRNDEKIDVYFFQRGVRGI